jgi:AhpC/TSA family
MRRVPSTLAALAVGAAVLAASPRGAAAQDAPAVPEPLAVGAVAPEFSLPGATRHGVLAEPVTLSEYAGKTVVLSFFFRARTRG